MVSSRNYWRTLTGPVPFDPPRDYMEPHGTTWHGMALHGMACAHAVGGGSKGTLFLTVLGVKPHRGASPAEKYRFQGVPFWTPRDYMGGLTCGPPCSCPGVSFYLEKDRFDVRARVVVVHTPGVACPCSPPDHVLSWFHRETTGGPCRDRFRLTPPGLHGTAWQLHGTA